MEEKKNNKGLICLLVILIILVLGLIGYIVYDKIILNDNSSNINEKNNLSTTTKNNKTLTDEEINNYLSYVPFSLLHEDAYHNDVTTINNVNKATLLFTVFHHESLNNSTFEDNENCWGGSCIIEEAFNKKLEEMYNIKINEFESNYDETEKWENFETYLLLKDGLYFELGYGGGKYKSKPSNVSYEFINDELIINEQIAIIVDDTGDVRIYNGSELIKEYTFNGDQTISFEEQAEEYIKDNIKDFNTYKHTFKKNSNNTYYWYSTEIVK